jgi:hypothetical protein
MCQLARDPGQSCSRLESIDEIPQVSQSLAVGPYLHPSMVGASFTPTKCKTISRTQHLLQNMYRDFLLLLCIMNKTAKQPTKKPNKQSERTNKKPNDFHACMQSFPPPRCQGFFFRALKQKKKKTKDSTPIFVFVGGTWVLTLSSVGSRESFHRLSFHMCSARFVELDDKPTALSA